jgi:hypothetical protein
MPYANRNGSQPRLPLKRQHEDPRFWAKLTALYHRERMREAYTASGERSHDARHRANREALEVAHRLGWRGNLPELKAELGELVVNDIPGRGKRDPGRRVRYWEEQVHVDLLRLLATQPATLKDELEFYLREEVQHRGRFSGRIGFYKLTHIVGYVPSMEHMEKRTAFLDALHAIGHDKMCCEREVYKVVLRLLRQYTRRPFETRLGVSMPAPTRPVKIRRRRKLFGFIPLAPR